jgi:acetoin utilization deacetylase AcuC-like enzyme
MATAFITHAACLRHDMGSYHPECPSRLAAIDDQLISSGIAQYLQHHDAPLATVDQLARVHPREYIEAIQAAAPEHGIVHLDPDTAMSPGTWEAVLRAAGAAVLATDLVLDGRAENASDSVAAAGSAAGLEPIARASQARPQHDRRLVMIFKEQPRREHLLLLRKR